MSDEPDADGASDAGDVSEAASSDANDAPDGAGDTLDGPNDDASEGAAAANDGNGEPDPTDRTGAYEAVTAHPAGDSTVDRYALTAASYDYRGVVVRTRTDADLSTIRAERGIDAVDAVEIDADDRASASGAVGNFRPEYTILAVRGNSEELVRFAVEQQKVDVVTAPFAGGDVNHVVVNRAAANGVRIEVNLGPVLRTAGGERVRGLRKLRKLRELLADGDARHVVSARPRSHRELRAPRELAAVGAQIGFDPETIYQGLREWGRLAARTRERRSESFISPGVRLGRCEEDDR